MCLSNSEAYKKEKTILTQNTKSRSSKPKQQRQQVNEDLRVKIEKQYISIYTDQINISHSTKTCPSNVSQLKYPTNYASFENLFQMSKTKDLITSNDASVSQCLFTESLISVPMVSIGIKSKYNSKTNKKQLLVALNFSNLSLHHTFSSQVDFWIFQLIEMFNLIDIDVIGYQGPIVLTELHLNVTNSCIIYKPVYLKTRSLIAFKSLHWSSNVAAESSQTLLVFNIEDIYLFLSKIDETNPINIKRDYICVANTDLFELRLLISDEEEQLKNKTEPRKSPLLDIKLRSNLIQFRTCVDSGFALVELINYIVSDGDLHQISPIMSEFMSHNSHPAQINPTLESKQQQAVIDELNSAIGLTKAITKASCSIPIQSVANINSSALFTVGTPPPSSSFKSSSSSASLSQQQFYSPLKNNSSSSYQASSTAASSFQDTYNQSFSKTQPITVPLPTPSLSFDMKTIASSSSNISKLNPSSSAESIISDMVKEAMTSNPLMQSVYGSLDSEPSMLKDRLNLSGRKRNTSLSIDMQTKRMISHDESSEFGLEEETNDLVCSNLTNKTLKEKCFSENENEDNFADLLIQNDKVVTMFGLNNTDEDENEKDDHDEDENLVNSIRPIRTGQEDDEFQFDMPFSDLGPMSPLSSLVTKKSNLHSSSFSYSSLLSAEKKPQPLLKTSKSSANNLQRKLYFKSNLQSRDTENEEHDSHDQEDDDDEDDDEDLLKDFDIIDVIPGFGEPPRNNQEYEIKFLKTQQQGSNKQIKYTTSSNMSHVIDVKEDHFKKPLTKIDVLKAPDTYPCPLNVYCVQEISINWFLYGGSDFSSVSSGINEFPSSNDELINNDLKSINRTLSSPTMVAGSQHSLASQSSSNRMATRSRTNSTSSVSLSVSPQSLNPHYYQSPPKANLSSSPTSQVTLSSTVKYSNTRSATVNLQKEKYLPRKAGGRIIKKYDNLNWLTRGGLGRNLDICMEIALHKVKTKIDLYADLNQVDASQGEKSKTMIRHICIE